MALAIAHAPKCLPDLAEPVTFAGQDAEDFLRDLPPELEPEALSSLRASAAAASELATSKSANSFFE